MGVSYSEKTASVTKPAERVSQAAMWTPCPETTESRIVVRRPQCK
jgi:hypothetical protein